MTPWRKVYPKYVEKIKFNLTKQNYLINGYWNITCHSKLSVRGVRKDYREFEQYKKEMGWV